MWQASTFDPDTIDKELGWAESIGMNTLRVYLHDLVWADDEKGLYDRMDQFLDICKKHHIRPFFVFFDDCHYPSRSSARSPCRWPAGTTPAGETARPATWPARYAEGKATDAEVAQLKGYVQEPSDASRTTAGPVLGALQRAGPRPGPAWATAAPAPSATSRTNSSTSPGSGPAR